ncbi:hypothetical protein PC116_g23873 [Phytophthora cactorum]|uniref:Uncharacterized protein n=1 Tax=Phytophthora cactorum TaxID=29920 RepID=A0A8T1JTJ6_9STRA|nr:hypothetical protein PC114_g21637 [Phytophthora cactorum]KAG2902326.1 hypothetical protein PC117_g21487 [Phytophthora cactorum]KAG2980279.1 hypothetical protein PC119_g21298 [Phytophthora cactorum]KAG4227753.1 hypothetical protein PC116_g23873 [Phytophthora cactorum]
MARDDSQLLMEDMKVFVIVKSKLVPCSVCALNRPHKTFVSAIPSWV